MLTPRTFHARLIPSYRLLNHNLMAGDQDLAEFEAVGAVAYTEADDTLSSAGALAITGSLAATEDADTVSSDATSSRGTITQSGLETSGSTANQDAYSTGSFDIAPYAMVVVWVVHRATTAGAETSVVDSRGAVTWTAVTGGVSAAATFRITAYYFFNNSGSATGSGTITFNYNNGDATSGCQWSVIQYLGVDPSTPYITTNVIASSAAAATTATVTLPNAMENAANAHVYGILHNADEGAAPGDFTETGDTNQASPATGLMTAFKLNDTSDSPTWTTSSTSRWVGLELKSAVHG